MIALQKFTFALGAGLLALSAGAAAQSVDYKPVEAKNIASGKQTIDPAKGYILITSPHRIMGSFIKYPDADEIAEYEAEWEEAFAKAQKKYAKTIVVWEEDRKAKRQVGEKPVEPTRETFSIGGIDRRMVASFGPQYVYEKASGADKSFTYLSELEPGTYAYYGPMSMVPGGGLYGACYCMGTVKFEVKPGVITNLGDFLLENWASDADVRVSGALLANTTGRSPVPPTYLVPASLSAYKVVPADWRAQGKLNNFYGIGIARFPTVPGVLAYDRDRIVDLRAQAEADAVAAAAQKAAAEALVDATSEAASASGTVSSTTE